MKKIRFNKDLIYFDEVILLLVDYLINTAKKGSAKPWQNQSFNTS